MSIPLCTFDTKAETLGIVADIQIRVALLTTNLTNITKITYLQAEIDSSMPAELEKCNETPKKFALTLNFAH